MTDLTLEELDALAVKLFAGGSSNRWKQRRRMALYLKQNRLCSICGHEMRHPVLMAKDIAEGKQPSALDTTTEHVITKLHANRVNDNAFIKAAHLKCNQDRGRETERLLRDLGCRNVK